MFLSRLNETSGGLYACLNPGFYGLCKVLDYGLGFVASEFLVFIWDKLYLFYLIYLVYKLFYSF